MAQSVFDGRLAPVLGWTVVFCAVLIAVVASLGREAQRRGSVWGREHVAMVGEVTLPSKEMRGAMQTGTAPPELVQAKPYLIEQDWAAYTPEQHAIWAELVSRRMPQLEEHACAEYLDGFEQIGLQQDQLPNLTAGERAAGAADRVGIRRRSVGFCRRMLSLRCWRRGCFRRRRGCGVARCDGVHAGAGYLS